ncbi:hypothetical protein TrVE_jg6673 [Triparma verrucosa]|uniref:Uncharacterized protein n=1 Tax=Triparma verrucosa TaxID=1606542 RepID=A0A9W7EKH1_9STRA|nr:hypothetical protein TrVE_jg6673 [Triparma verrucosa]
MSASPHKRARVESADSSLSSSTIATAAPADASEAYLFTHAHLKMLIALYDEGAETLATCFDLAKQFLDGRAVWANSLAANTPFVVGDSDNDEPPTSTAVLALRRRFSFMKDEASKPKCLPELAATLYEVISATKVTLEDRAEKYRQTIVEAQLGDQHPPLVYHDDELSLISNRLMLWERLQSSVSCVASM